MVMMAMLVLVVNVEPSHAMQRLYLSGAIRQAPHPLVAFVVHGRFSVILLLPLLYHRPANGRKRREGLSTPLALVVPVVRTRRGCLLAWSCVTSVTQPAQQRLVL